MYFISSSKTLAEFMKTTRCFLPSFVEITILFNMGGFSILEIDLKSNTFFQKTIRGFRIQICWNKP